MEETSMEDNSMSDESNTETRTGFQEDIESLLQISAEFDPKFDPEHAPRIALLCQTCHTALQTATRLAESERQRQKLTLGALRVRIWGTDIFDATNSTPLDELLSSVAGHTSLRRHLIGVWADTAATLELILFLLIRQTGQPSPESCTQWRRLRIVLGVDGISTAIHDGFSLPGLLDGGIRYGDHNGVVNNLISSLEELIDCLFDLLVTIGTIRQLHQLGYEPTLPGSPTFCAVEEQAKISSKAAEDSRVPSSLADGVISHPTPLYTEPIKLQEVRSQGLEDGLVDNESCRISESAMQDVPTDGSNGKADLSGLAVHDGPTESQTEPIGQEDPPELVNTTETAKVAIDKVETSAETSSQALSANTRRFQKPIKFFDCYARTFVLPFELCCTWKDMQNLIRESFQSMTGPYADATRRYIEQGKYDLVSCFDNETIMPSLWEFVLEPGMTVRMVLYQLPPKVEPRPRTYYSTQDIYPSDLPSSNFQVYDIIDKESLKSQEKGAKERKGSHDEEEKDDDHRTSTVSNSSAQRAGPSLPSTDTTRNIDKTSLKDVGPSVTWASEIKKQRYDRTVSTEAEMYPRRSPAQRPFPPPPRPPPASLRRSSHPHRALPSSSSLPRFEDLGVEKIAPRSAARPLTERDYGLGGISVDSTYGSITSTSSSYPGSLYPDPTSSYVNQSNVLAPENTGPIPRDRWSSYAPSVIQAPRSSQSSKQPEYLDPSKVYSDLKQMILDEKAAREGRESVAKKLADEERAKAEKDRFIAEQIAAAEAAAAANARLEFAQKEAEKRATESEKAEAERKERAAAAAAATNPEPIHLTDCTGRKYTFPYQHCYTWKGMEDLINQAFLNNNIIKSRIIEGHYDLLSPSGDTILPALWENLVEPGWEVTMKLRPIDGYQPISKESETQGLPTSDLGLTAYSSTTEPQALVGNPSNSTTSPLMSGQSTNNLNIPEHSSTLNDDVDISHPSSEDEEPSEEELENRGRVWRWKDSILHPLRRRKLAAAENQLEDV